MTRKRARLILWITLETLFLVFVFVGLAEGYDSVTGTKMSIDFIISRTLSGVTRDVFDNHLSSNVSFLAKALEVLGEWPAILLVSFALCVAVRNLRKKVNDTRVLILMLAFDAAVALLMFRGWYGSVKDIFGSANIRAWHYIFIVIFTLASSFMMRFAVSKLKKSVVKSFFFPAVVTIITAAVLLVCLEIIKFAWGRVRLREIVEYSKTIGSDAALAKFTPWYIPNWFSGSKSFPSGHTAYSTLLFIIPIWFPKGASEKSRRLTYVGVGAWVLILGFSRLCAAAHYMTDVVFGFAIAFVIVQAAMLKYEKTFESRPVPKFIRTAEVSQTGAAAPVAVERGARPDVPKTSLNTKEILKREQSSTEQPPTEPLSPQRRAAPPAREVSPPVKAVKTSFSLDRARAERAASEARAAEMASKEAKRLDDSLKLAVTGDISIPVVPKRTAPASAQKKQKAASSKKPRQKRSAQSDNAVQMHFRYDSENKTFTSDLSDD